MLFQICTNHDTGTMESQVSLNGNEIMQKKKKKCQLTLKTLFCKLHLVLWIWYCWYKIQNVEWDHIGDWQEFGRGSGRYHSVTFPAQNYPGKIFKIFSSFSWSFWEEWRRKSYGMLSWIVPTKPIGVTFSRAVFLSVSKEALLNR